mmetsp:Transcript_19435/g.44269  ORF Transcript_19435/g.44269 Transcript_19435/m.44269 type:complete len:202 (-) Transcript_19435:173-778(-)
MLPPSILASMILSPCFVSISRYPISLLRPSLLPPTPVTPRSVRTNMSAEYTTDELDQNEARRLHEKLAAARPTAASSSSFPSLPSVHLDEGVHKYVLIRAVEPATADGAADRDRTFVVSKRGAAYHRDVAEPFVDRLLEGGWAEVRITGGGRIHLDAVGRKVKVYGFSYGFGKGNHRWATKVIGEDERFEGFDISWSDEGY